MNDLSVIMPLHDAAPWVGDAIQSVLDHADGLLELLVIDDGSTDDGPRIAAGFGGPVRVLTQANAGPSAARNRGLAEARGRLIGFLDADDRWCASRPDPRRAVLDADPAIDLVLARLQPICGPAGQPSVPVEGTIGGLHLGGMLARADALRRYGGMDETIVHGEDVDWILRMRDAGARVQTIDDVTAQYRVRQGSLTRDRPSTDSGLIGAIHASLRRRGAVGR
jgi:glycosyltransferase involved in cell wall biosynthesis